MPRELRVISVDRIRRAVGLPEDAEIVGFQQDPANVTRGEVVLIVSCPRYKELLPRHAPRVEYL